MYMLVHFPFYFLVQPFRNSVAVAQVLKNAYFRLFNLLTDFYLNICKVRKIIMKSFS